MERPYSLALVTMWIYFQILCGLRDRTFSSDVPVTNCVDTVWNLYPRQAIREEGRYLGIVAKY